MMVNTTSDEWVSLHARQRPERIAVQDDSTELTYKRLEACISRGAAWLLAQRNHPGDRIGLLGAPCADWVVAYLSISRAGCIPVGLNYRETADCISQQLESAGIEQVFSDKSHQTLIRSASTKVIPLEGFTRAAANWEHQLGARPADAASSGVILFTGGTTGSSKGVDLTHVNLLWNCLNEIQAGDLTQEDNVLIATALHHSAALNTWLLPQLYLGGTATILGDFDPRRWLDFMRRFRATATFTPPTMIRQILDESSGADDWGSFRKWFSGAGILSAQDRSEMMVWCPELSVYYEYGLTEAGPIVTCQRPEDYPLNPKSIGRPVKHCEVKLLTDDGKVASQGEVGEIVVRGPAIMRGYWGQTRETEKVLRDGWLHTGDLATMDNHGCLVFHDRLKDMIKTGGLNVFSQEVEAVLSTHPDISEVAVVGLPDERWGERVVAVVSLKTGADLTSEDIIRFAKSKLAGYQVPKEVFFKSVPELPKNYLGKTLKRELRQMLTMESA
jgi:fatty-acyl-CoA synthase